MTMYRLELRPRTASTSELLDDLRALSTSQPFIEQEITPSKVVLLTRGTHVAMLIDALADTEISVEAIEGSSNPSTGQSNTD